MKVSNETIERAKEEQSRLAFEVIREDFPPVSGTSAIGVDVAYVDGTAVGTAVSIDYSDFDVRWEETVFRKVEVPYIPGYFFLREGPVLEYLLKKMKPSLPVLVDANGILHPRRCGLASWLGVRLNIQTIGVAKNLLIGNIGNRVGDSADVLHEGEIIGKAVWLKGKKKPIFVSIGNRVSLETAVRIVKESTKKYYPEPLRLAHKICSKEAKK